MSLLNKRKLKDAALHACECSGLHNKCRVGQSFIDHIESEVRRAIAKRVNHHDNKTGARKTLE